MNQIKDELNVKEASCRDIVVDELMYLLRSEPYKFMSWGSHAFTVDDMKKPTMFKRESSQRVCLYFPQWNGSL